MERDDGNKMTYEDDLKFMLSGTNWLLTAATATP